MVAKIIAATVPAIGRISIKSSLILTNSSGLAPIRSMPPTFWWAR